MTLKLGYRWLLLLGLLTIALVGCQAAGDTNEQPTASPSSTVERQDQPYTVGFTADGHPFKGNPDADVVIEEFSSYQCPYCGRYFAEVYPDLMRRYVETGQVLYIFMDFPLSGQPQSPKAAEAANCAGQVGGAPAFWNMHDMLFQRQREWSGRSDAGDIFKQYATELGLDQTTFDDCLDNGLTAAHVKSDSSQGMSRGVRGTPSFFINDQVLVGVQPLSAFASLIEGTGTGEPSAADAGGAQPTNPDLFVPTPAAFAFQEGEGSDTLLALGDPNAPVVIVEFTDYQCPFCARHFRQTWPTLKSQYIDSGRVYFVLKDFPLTSIHPQATKAAQAARCARQVGGDDAYWQMHDRLFMDQDSWANNADAVNIFKSYANKIGLDRGAFDTCLDSGQTAEAVQADLEEGRAYGVTGTPTFFIAGYPFSGAQPIEFFDMAISLAENGQLRQAIADTIARAQAEQQQPRPTMAPADVPIGDAPSIGAADAPVTIIEYSDYQCPFCARHFQQTLPRLLETYVNTGKVRYVFKDFPLSSIHPQAVQAAQAARCAREVGGDDAYWQMHDRLFARQQEWAENPEHTDVFKTFAGELGLDQAAFDACLDSGRYESAVMADLREGAGFGVSGTPAFFINGQPLRGAQPYQVFEQLIEAELAGE